MKQVDRNKGETPVGAFGYPTADLAALREKALAVIERLNIFYGVAAWATKDPLSMLVEIMLSHRTRDEQTHAAYANLLKRFGSWEGVRDAPVEKVQEAIKNVNWPEVKAPRLQEMLRRVTAERGELNLDFLRELPVEEGAAWLDRLEGVGPKTRSCVLLFSCRKPILPVDTHVYRVSQRLGLIGKKVSPKTAHDLLLKLLPDDAQVIHDFHKDLLRHGQRICVYGVPHCWECPVTDLCDYYKTVVCPKRQREAKPDISS